MRVEAIHKEMVNVYSIHVSGWHKPSECIEQRKYVVIFTAGIRILETKIVWSEKSF